jgi:hypothetical protein
MSQELLSEYDLALMAFDRIRAGQLDRFYDGTGLDDTDFPDAMASLVTIENVDSYEQYYRQRWLGGVANSDV